MKLKVFATYRDITKLKELEMDAPSTALDLLRLLARRYGPPMEKKIFTSEGDISADVILLVNGRNIKHLEDGATPLSDEDTVSLFPMVAGG